MPDDPMIKASTIEQWINEKLDAGQLQNKLTALGWEEETIAIHIKEFKKVKYAKRRQQGFIYMAAGAFFGFISCVLALINPIPELHDWFLYGLTSFAFIIAFLGLYFIFE
jgi:hypothetical protein